MGRHRSQRARLDGQQHLERLGADASADELRPFLGPIVLIRTTIIHLGDIAQGAVEEHHHHVLAVVRLNDLFQVVNVVGGDSSGTGRGMAGKVDDAADQFAVLVPDADDAYLGIDRSRGLDDVRIELSGVGHGQPAAHLKPTIERHLVLDALAHAGAN